MSFSKDKMEASFDPSVTKKQSEGITSVKKKGLTYSQSSEKSHNSKYASKMLHAKNKHLSIFGTHIDVKGSTFVF